MALAILHSVRRSLIVTTVLTSVLACNRDERTVAGGHVLSAPTQLCREGAPLRSCRTPDAVEALLQRDDLEILAASETSTGVQRARVLTLRSGGPDPVVFRAKWRAHTTTTRRNSPRFELAAYAVQKLFLAPGQYVVPPTAAQCVPLEAYRARVDPAAQPTFRGSGCVYGILSYWLEGVTSIADARKAGWFHGVHDHAFDPDLFARDPGYRDSIARVNLLTYVIGHADSHARNFVLARAGALPVGHAVYSVDNSLAFTMHKNPRLEPRHDWSVIRVPALPRDAIERLRSARERLPSLEKIAVLRLAAGEPVVVGLTAPEIDGIRVRIDALLARVNRGELRLY